MEDAEDVNVAIVFDEVGDTIVPVQEDAHVARGSGVEMTNLWEGGEDLRSLIDSLDRARRSVGVIGGDVLEDVLEPTLSFLGPGYFCHERMRRPISSLEMVRFASESASPRSTMT